MIELPEPALKNVNPTYKRWNGKSWVDAGGVDVYTADQLRTCIKKAAADALQEMERVPMTEEQRRERLPVGLLTTEELYYFRGLRDAEAFHNITPPDSKVSG